MSVISRRLLLMGAASGAALWLGPFRVASRDVQADTLVAEAFPALGTRVRIVVRTLDKRHAQWAIRQAMAAVFSVHRSMTLHDESPLTVLNRRGALEVPDGLIAVLGAAMEVNRASGGVFDPTVSAATPGLDRVELDTNNRMVRLHHPGCSLDFNGIAKGFAVDCAVDALRAAGFTDFLVNAGGDLYAAGSDGTGAEGWDIRLDLPGISHGWRVSNRAVATSGSMHQPNHLLNPVERAPVRKSASVRAKDCMTADAWATVLSVRDAHTRPNWGRDIEGDWVNSQGVIVRPV